MTQWERKRYATAFLVAAGTLLRVAFVTLHPWIAGDSLMYGDLARNILIHHVFGFAGDPVRPTLIRLPGYPLFLAACFAVFGVGNFVAALWVQVVVDLAGCWLLGRLAERLMGERVGLIVLGLAMLCPFTANYCAVPLSETCTIFCVVLAFYSLERWAAGMRAGRRWNRWLAGIVFALAYGILLRPDEALVAMVVLPAMVWMAWRAEAWKALGPAIVAGVLMSVPFVFWGMRNWRVFHVVQPLAPRYATDPWETNPYGFQKWYRTWATDFEATVEVYWNYDGTAVSFGDVPARAFDSAAQRAETERLFAEYNDSGKSSPALDRAFGRLADERIAAHPLRYYVWVPALKLADMWLRPRTAYMPLPLDWWRFGAHRGKSWVSLGYGLLNLGYLALGVVGLWRWRRDKWGGHTAMAAAMVAFVGLRCVLLWTIDNSEPRYTLECFPVVILMAGYALARRRRTIHI